jgi:hypothetical protein
MTMLNVVGMTTPQKVRAKTFQDLVELGKWQ